MQPLDPAQQRHHRRSRQRGGGTQRYIRTAASARRQLPRPPASRRGCVGVGGGGRCRLAGHPRSPDPKRRPLLCSDGLRLLDPLSAAIN